MTPGSLPLEGVRVLDLTWVIAGPVCTKMLADQGAEVIKIESAATMDPIRMSGQWLHHVNTAPDGGATFSHYNRNKRSATLNLKHPEGRALLLELAKKSDAIVNNYSAGAMARLGLGFEELHAANPRLVVAELSGMGQTGPYSRYVAFGMTLMALAGAYELTGYPDGIPFMPGYTFTDFAAASMGAFAIIAALRWRDQGGEGQYLDLGQFQMGAALFADEQFEYLVTGNEPGRQGNFEEGALVHGVYRCAGEDAWCTIAARTREEWQILARLGVIPPWLDERYEHVAAAPAVSRAEVDAAVEAWTLTRDKLAITTLLQDAGVDAAPVQTADDLVHADPQLAAREWFQEYTHLSGEQVGIDGMPFRMSATPARVRSGGPLWGADNQYVFGELLGLSEAEIRRLEDAGVIG
jgi:crotonobetainyl-CoA:carnitine CoA-transferase CaiB-like acyl-CoA transferase